MAMLHTAQSLISFQNRPSLWVDCQRKLLEQDSGERRRSLRLISFRLGFIAAPKYVIKEATKLIGTMVSCVNVPTQKGYAAFLKSDKDMAIRREFVQRLTKKRDTIVNLFQTLPGFESLEICAPDGAFYFFPNFNGYLGKKTAEGETIETDEALSLYLLKEAKVAMLAGSHFGKPGRLRLAFAAASDEHIEKGIKGMALALSKLQ